MKYAAPCLAALLAACGTSTPEHCTSSRECSAAMLVCDVAHARCVECNDDLDCLDPTTVCVDHACVPYTACTTSRQCPGQVCDTRLGYCVDCVTDPDCPDAGVCRGSVCTAPPLSCASDRVCTPMGQVCDLVSGTCVDCVRDADCAAGTCSAMHVCAR